jgi:fructan beta-fructosidase
MFEHVEHVRDDCFLATYFPAIGARKMTSDDIHPSDVADAYHYHGQYRPQFHYTPMHGHIGDATGLIYYKGEYHLFYMYDPWSTKRAEHKNWGHAISNDCLHWREMPPILDTLIDHRPGSGGGIVDWNNSSGLRRGIEKTFMVFYTDYVLGTCIAYSNDKGRTWVRHRLNPILEGTEDIRDPYVFWYKPASSWRMVRYEKKGFAFYESADLLSWRYLSRSDGFYECPDIFELAVDGDSQNRKWVLIDGDGTYLIGMFDGTGFTAETEKLQVNYGQASHGRLYATQSWKHTFEGDGPVVQLAFVGYVREPRLTWIGQMCFPCELTLRTRPDGIRLFRYPLPVIKNLYSEQRVWHDTEVHPGITKFDGAEGDALDIHVEIEPAGAQTFGLEIRGQRLTYDVQDRTLSWNESVPLALVNSRIRLRIMLDRSSIEVFGNDGQLSLTNLFFPDTSNREIKLFAEGGSIRVAYLEINHVESIWQERELALGVFKPSS